MGKQKGSPGKCSHYLSTDTVTDIRKSALTIRMIYRRFIQPTHPTMSERMYYHATQGRVTREEWVEIIESMVDTYLREPHIVLERVRAALERGEHYTLTHREAGALLALDDLLQ